MARHVKTEFTLSPDAFEITEDGQVIVNDKEVRKALREARKQAKSESLSLSIGTSIGPIGAGRIGGGGAIGDDGEYDD